MRVGIGDTGEDGVSVEQMLKPGEIDTHRTDQQQECKCDGQPAPGKRRVSGGAASGECARTSSDEGEENGDRAGNCRQRHQPAHDELPGWKSKKIEVQGLAKDGIDNVASDAWRVPIERERRPLHHHAGANRSGDNQRNAESSKAQDWLNRQSYGLSGDENRVTTRQVGKVCSLQS